MKLLSKIFLIFVLMSTPAHTANLFVPDQHPTIQAAVDAASPGDRILVGPGNYAGAIIDKWVKISGAGNETVITEGFQPGRFWTAFRIVSGADKTEISDLTIAMSGPPDVMMTGIDIWPFPSPAPIKGVIRNVKFIDTARAVRIRNSSGWIITENIIAGLRDPYWSSLAIGIWLHNTGNSLVANNTIESAVFGLPHLIYIGVNLSANPTMGPVDNNKIVNNTIAVSADFALKANDIELFQGGTIDCEGNILIVDNKIIANQVSSILPTPLCLADLNVIR
jgi:hypothetical protein